MRLWSHGVLAAELDIPTGLGNHLVSTRAPGAELRNDKRGGAATQHCSARRHSKRLSRRDQREHLERSKHLCGGVKGRPLMCFFYETS